MAAYGLYSHIQSNRRRSVVLLAGLFFLVYVMVYAGALVAEGLSVDADINTLLQLAWTDFLKAAPFATVGAAAWIVIAYYFHQDMIDALTGGREVERRDQPRLYNILENLCISRGIPTPKLKIMDSDALNAFATGMSPKQYSITVTTGLLKTLDDAEIESVLGHELTHIRNGDVRMMVIAVIIAGVVSFFTELIFRLWFYNGFGFGGSRSERRGGGSGAILIAVGLLVVAYVLSFVIRLALSRSREYLADAGSVELTKNPDAMISALRKIEGRGELKRATSAVMEMCIDNPREGFGELFDTHPTVESRVAALVKFAGGHDPGPLALPPLPSGVPGDQPGLAEPSADASAGPWGPETAPNDTSATPGPWSEPQTEAPAQPNSESSPQPAPGPWDPRRTN
ncbi:MAG TPA: M48 family metalloprotease [Xanthobacteraceae bacterium]|nr:M48 family metalloprotease [Xanthobacteraceae bacterium]